MSHSATGSLDPTFRNYTPEQAAAYEIGRDRGTLPSDNVFEEVLRFHSARDGQLDTALDVGCGTGQAARVLAHHFTHVVGVDPGEHMISQAQRVGGETKGGVPIEYEVRASEELDTSAAVSPASVDLLTAQMSASKRPRCCNHSWLMPPG